MTVLKLTSFGALAPILDARKLPDGGATIANNARLDGGDLRSFDSPLPVNYNGGITSIFSKQVTRLYRYTSPTGNKIWLAWSATTGALGADSGVKDPVPSPIPQDGRLYWTRGSFGATNYPAFYSKDPTLADTLAGIIQGGVRPLGIPKPTQAPSITVTAAAAPASVALAYITRSNPAYLMIPAGDTNPFVEGDQVRIVVDVSGQELPINMSEISGKEYLLGPKIVDTPIGVTNPGEPIVPPSWPHGTYMQLRGSNSISYTPVTTPAKISVSRVSKPGDEESRAYVYTLVSDAGEEGPPSAPSDVVDVPLDGTAKMTFSTSLPNGYDHVTRARFYRTVSGNDGTRFFFVKETTLTVGLTVRPATPDNTVLDDVDPLHIGELMPSQDWTAPVAGMFGLTQMPNGFMIAAKGNTVYACVPYQPHAWPDKYRKTADFNIVGMATMGQSAVIATEGNPYLATGSDPESFTISRLDINAPCICQRGIVSTGDSVLYPTYEGLAMISPSGSRLLTPPIMDKELWLALWAPSSNTKREATYHEGRYIVLASGDNSDVQSFCLRLVGNAIELTMLPDIKGRAPSKDTIDDSLHYVDRNNGAFNALVKFDGDPGLPMTYLWQSKTYTLAKPENFAAAQVFASGSVVVTIEALKLKAVGPKVWEIVRSLTVDNSEPFRLESGFTAREWRVRALGTSSVQEINLATSMSELSSA